MHSPSYLVLFSGTVEMLSDDIRLKFVRLSFSVRFDTLFFANGAPHMMLQTRRTRLKTVGKNSASFTFSTSPRRQRHQPEPSFPGVFFRPFSELRVGIVFESS
jgi:hypothetical protein